VYVYRQSSSGNHFAMSRARSGSYSRSSSRVSTALWTPFGGWADRFASNQDWALSAKYSSALLPA